MAVSNYQVALVNLNKIAGEQPTDVTEAGAAYAQAFATLALVDAINDLREALTNV